MTDENAEKVDERSGSGVESHWQGIGERRRKIASVREKMNEDRGSVGRQIDAIGQLLTRPKFFAVFLAVHLAWIAFNIRGAFGLEPFDPYPFLLLATIASAEAPFIALLILMHQERDRRIEELRNEVNLQVSLHTEETQTAIIRMLRSLGERLDVRFDELEERPWLAEDLDPDKLLSTIEAQLEAVEHEAPGD